MAISQWVLHKTFASAWPTFLAAVGWLCLRLAYRFQAALPPFRLHISALFCVFWLPPHMNAHVTHSGKPPLEPP